MQVLLRYEHIKKIGGSSRASGKNVPDLSFRGAPSEALGAASCCFCCCTEGLPEAIAGDLQSPACREEKL